MKRSNRSSTKLTLQTLESRVNPATVTWEGDVSNLWNVAGNWQGDAVPVAADDVVLSGTRTFSPFIDAGQSFTINHIWFAPSVTFDLIVNGTLTTKGSLLQATEAHGVVGTGTLTLTDTAAAAVDHSWQTGYVKVRTVGVEGGAVWDVLSTFGQLGPDNAAQATSNWKVGTTDSAGTLKLHGDHFVGFNWLTIVKGEAKYVIGGTLTDIPPPPPAAWRPFAIENVDKFEIAEGQAVALTGGRYLQSAGTTTFQPGSSLNIAGFAGADPVPAYSFDVLAGKVVAYESAGVTIKTDLRVSDAVIEFNNPGVFTRSGGPEQTSALALVARDGTTNKEVLIQNTPVKQLDWNPAGRYTSTTQSGGKVNVGGNLMLSGTTELVLRVNVGNNQMDKVFDATGTVTLRGYPLSRLDTSCLALTS